MSIQNTHPEYDEFYPRWRKNRDAVRGQDAVHKGGRRYLPDDAVVVDADSIERYNRYITRATWTPVTTYTLDGLTGAVFSKPPAVELPPEMDALVDNIDGAGRSIEQLARYAVKEVLTVGRVGFMVDYPQAREGLSLEQTQSLRPKVVCYAAETIDNWRYGYDATGKTQLIMVKLVEPEMVYSDEFTAVEETRYRVLRLNDSGYYEQGLYTSGGELIGDLIEPRKANGERWTHIPFYFAGTNNNLPTCDPALLSGIVDLNFKHYRVAADLAKNLHIHAGGLLVISSDMSVDDWNEANPNGITVGADQGLFLGAGGSAQLLQLAPSSQSHVELENIRAEMVGVGARLITQGGQAETAEAARINASAEGSALTGVVGNISEAIEWSLADMCEYLGANPDSVEFALNTVFFNESVDPTMLVAAMQLNDRQKLSDLSLIELMKKANLVAGDVVAEDELEQAQQNAVALPDLGLGLNAE